jgi:hypothetical protein
MTNFEGIAPNLPLWSFQFQPNSKLGLRTRKDLEIHLITRALKDEEFKRELIANPKAVIESELGTKLPDELEINVLEETEDTIYMVLPCNPYDGMSEEQLQASFGMTYEDVAQWVLEYHQFYTLDTESNLRIISKIWIDERFKYNLLSQTKNTLEKDLEIQAPDSFDLQAIEETKNRIYLLLPKIFDNFNLNEICEEAVNTPVIACTFTVTNCGSTTTLGC